MKAIVVTDQPPAAINDVVVQIHNGCGRIDYLYKPD